MGWVRFNIIRTVVFSLLFLTSIATIALSGLQAAFFIKQKYDHPFLIFALVVASISVIASLGLAAKYTFKSHIGCIALLCILWLSLASYVTDRIGYVQCESLTGTLHPTNDGDGYDAVAWCKELKAIMGLSWFNFGLLIIAIVSWIRLQEFEEREGLGWLPEGAREAVREAEEANFENRQEAGRFQNGYPLGANGLTGYGNGFTGQPGVLPAQGGTVVYQQPGHNVVLQNGVIRQVPVGAPI